MDKVRGVRNPRWPTESSFFNQQHLVNTTEYASNLAIMWDTLNMNSKKLSRSENGFASVVMLDNIERTSC